MRTFSFSAAVLCFFAFSVFTAGAQSGAGAANGPTPVTAPSQAPAASPQTPTAVPSDPAQFLEMATKLNGLTGADLKPWHLKASYEIFDEKGAGAGTYEEWWVNDKQDKRSYVSAKFSQTDYSTPAGLFRVGEQKWPGFKEGLVRGSLVDPLPGAAQLGQFHIVSGATSINNLKLSCVSLRYSVSDNEETFSSQPNFYPSYCFDANTPILRFGHTNTLLGDVTYNGIARFQGHYIARNVSVLRGDKVVETIKLEVLEGLKAALESTFKPPAEAVPVGAPSLHNSSILRILKFVPPQDLPELPMDDLVRGRVHARVAIGKDGHVVNVIASKGAKLLTPVTLESIRQWTFRPFLICGEAVDVEMEIEAEFNLQ